MLIEKTTKACVAAGQGWGWVVGRSGMEETDKFRKWKAF